MNNIITINELKEHADTIIQKGLVAPLFITKDDNIKAVIIDITAYNDE